MAITDTLKDNIVPVCVVLIIVGSVFLTLSIITILVITDTVAKIDIWEGLYGYIDYIGPWSYWVIFLAGASLAVGAGYLYSYVKDSREFEELIDTHSKKVFIKNYERLEELAWNLTSKHRERLYAKMDELKVRIK